MSGHTPGPWKVTPDSFVMSGTKPSIGVAKIITHVYEFPANARLIAAAPDLLEALKDVVSAYETLTSVGWQSAERHVPQTMGPSYRAIAKAEGR